LVVWVAPIDCTDSLPKSQSIELPEDQGAPNAAQPKNILTSPARTIFISRYSRKFAELSPPPLQFRSSKKPRKTLWISPYLKKFKMSIVFPLTLGKKLKSPKNRQNRHPIFRRFRWIHQSILPDFSCLPGVGAVPVLDGAQGPGCGLPDSHMSIVFHPTLGDPLKTPKKSTFRLTDAQKFHRV
jgi:hypothetical protein